MKKRFMALMGAALLTAACIAGCANAGSSSSSDTSSSASSETPKVQVAASFYPLADLAQKVGGDRVNVTNMVPAGTEPHEWEPSTADMRTLESADVFAYNGAGMESWVDDVLSSLSSSKLVSVNTSDGLDLRTDDEGTPDPHVWLNPANAKKQMAAIRDALIKADPDGKDTYEANYETYAQKFDELDQEYREKLAGVANKSIVVSHEAFGYLCDAYGLEQKPIEGLDAESEPDAKTMAEIVDFVRQNKVKTIFSEDLVSPKIAQQIANETGASCEVLNPLEGLTEEQLSQGEDYFSVMEDNLDKLVKALS